MKNKEIEELKLTIKATKEVVKDRAKQITEIQSKNLKISRGNKIIAIPSLLLLLFSCLFLLFFDTSYELREFCFDTAVEFSFVSFLISCFYNFYFKKMKINWLEKSQRGDKAFLRKANKILKCQSVRV